MKLPAKLWFKYKFWRAPIRISCNPATPEYDSCIEFKIVDGKIYVLKEYRNYKSVDDYQAELFKQLLPKLKKHLGATIIHKIDGD